MIDIATARKLKIVIDESNIEYVLYQENESGCITATDLDSKNMMNEKTDNFSV